MSNLIRRHRMMVSTLIICLLLGAVGSARPSAAQGSVYYVSTTGIDTPSHGTNVNPWLTITYALTQVPDGSTILVKPGEYVGRVRLSGNFAQGVTVRSEVPYQARLRNTADKVITTYDGCSGITLEGFDIAHGGEGAVALVVHIDGGGEQNFVHHLTLYNNIIHDSYNNDILKINNGAHDITVRGNMFYNQSGSDEHMDVNSVVDVIIEDNVFFNDFAGSGRTNDNDTSAYVVIKDSNSDDDWVLGSKNITVRRNVFLNWQGSTGYGFVQVGEDATANFEADGVLVENNLMLGNSANTLRSPIGIMGSRAVTFRNNTVVGNFPSLAFALRLYRINPNQPNQDIFYYNNVWSDPTGTLEDFSDSPSGQTTSFAIERNLYWNNGAAIPQDSNELVNYTNDAQRLIANPLLGSQTGLIVPRWNPGTNHFADGSTSIRAAFEKLVALYGTPASTSPIVNAADPTHAPGDDILGHARTTPDLGAVEFVPTLILHGASRSHAIDLNWTISAALPATSTWRLAYYSQTVPITINTIVSPTRAYELNGLTNYVWYTVTLQAMLGTLPFLTDTIKLMPTDRLVYLPLILK
ncbi:hypothetical protein TFLX_00356 [Thermoflexales bacterium]|nr:hypothetical protein TFLX_00356 [Thermoflexales bacterium]